MIIVFCELEGHRLLGKARELADAAGHKVIGTCSNTNGNLASRLVAMGADEVVTTDADDTREWSAFFADLISKSYVGQSGFLLLPSNIFSDLVIGEMSRNNSPNFDTGEEVDEIVEGGWTKNFGELEYTVGRDQIRRDLCVLSLKVDALSEPFEDPSRYGRATNLKIEFHSNDQSFPKLSEFEKNAREALTILVEKGCLESKAFSKLLEALRIKYSARILEQSGRVEIIYGPCLAIEVASRMFDLPEFRGELIALNSSESHAIQRIASTKIVTSDVWATIKHLVAI
jgi:hypothetical protein